MSPANVDAAWCSRSSEGIAVYLILECCVCVCVCVSVCVCSVPKAVTIKWKFPFSLPGDLLGLRPVGKIYEGAGDGALQSFLRPI